MHTKVVHRTAKMLSDRFSLESLRFNFRGVGASGGRVRRGPGRDGGPRGRRAWMRRRRPFGPCVVAGFSFGSLCALRAAPRLSPDVLLLIGLPDRTGGTAPRRRATPWPVIWIQGGKRRVQPGRKVARDRARRAAGRFSPCPGADHFFAGKLDEFERAAGDALDDGSRGAVISDGERDS